MTDTSSLETTGRATSPRGFDRERGRLCRWGAAVYVLAGCGSTAVVSYGVVRLPAVHTNHAFGHTGLPFIDGWLHWDAGWYLEIARHGYSYAPNRQSSVAFFPLYPLAMRAVGALVGGPLAAGMLLTIAGGATASVLLAAWLAARFDEQTVRTGVFLFVLGPYSFYLFGAVYSDAMFTAASLAAFVLLERRRPVLAGLAGAIATACRPVGIIVVIALALRTRELRADSPGRPLSRAAPALETPAWSRTPRISTSVSEARLRSSRANRNGATR